jgi:oligoribonuclease
MAASLSPCLVWLDLEMTGLDPNACAIIEVGVILTGGDLQPVAELERVVWQPEEVLLRMEPVVKRMHTENGLLERVRASEFSLANAERDVLTLLARHCAPGEGILTGNSIHTDRSFLARHMPAVDRYLHYRQLDVSSLKVLQRAWFPGSPELRKQAAAHTALSDLRAGIQELAHYRDTLFKPRT